MNRLQTEWRRLYLPAPVASAADPGLPLIDAADRVRALVVEVTAPASWEVLGKVWQGAQTELELPAPAIAVSGVDGLQLWFSLAEPVAVGRGHAFLAALVARFLPEVPAKRLRLWPAMAASTSTPERHARPVPAEQGRSGNWSAFIAADLAPIFAETPWLDIPPGEEGQTNLLRGLHSIAPAAFEAAWTLATPPAGRAPIGAAGGEEAGGLSTVEPSPAAAGTGRPTSPAPSAAHDDPRRFLLQVMNDAAAPLALRIEAAKALLPNRALPRGIAGPDT